MFINNLFEWTNKLWNVQITEYYTTIKRKNYCYTHQHSWISKTLQWTKKAKRQKNTKLFIILLIWRLRTENTKYGGKSQKVMVTLSFYMAFLNTDYMWEFSDSVTNQPSIYNLDDSQNMDHKWQWLDRISREIGS